MLGLLGVSAASIWLAVVSHGRLFFTFGTETDFLARNIAEAIRFLEKMPLLVQFHPPFYSMVLAGMKIFISDWFRIGLLVSWLSSTAVLLTSYLFFYRVAGPYAAFGCLASLMGSRLFVSQSCLATQDMFFLALYSLSFFLALQAILRKSALLWVMTGLILGCATITRSNSLTLLILLVAPFAIKESLPRQIRNIACCLLAFAIIVGSWVIYAKQTGSPVSPAYGQVNLAMRYFPTKGDPFSVKSRQELKSKFDSYLDVMAHDPVYVANEYIKDAWRMVRHNLFTSELMPLYWALVALAGVVLLFWNWHTPFAILFLISTLAQIGLVNFKSYEPRFYLFIIPLLGAGLGLVLQTVFNHVKKPRAQIVVWILLFVLLLPNFRWSYKRALNQLHREDQELAEATVSIKNITGKSNDNIIVSLKPHIPYYTGTKIFIDDGYAKLPDFATEDELQQWLLALNNKGTVYLYFGSAERRARSDLKFLSEPETAPIWLESVIYGQAGKGWVFYRFHSELSG